MSRDPMERTEPMSLAEYAATYWWSARCPTCKKQIDFFDLTPFAERWPGITFDEFKRRLVHSACGTKCPTGVGGAKSQARR